MDTEQLKLWNGQSGQAWVEAQDLLDRVLQPFEDLLLREVAALSPTRVLDIGCGTGSTTLAIARRLGTRGQCTGVDISEPMLALARSRAAREGSTAQFVRADAQTHTFVPGSADLVVSRFGVMFFEDPVQAFTNLRQATAADGALRCIAWRSAAENPFMTTAERSAGPLLPDLPPRRPDGPGQFAFGSESRVRAILEEGGWSDVEVRPIDVACAMPEPELTRYFTRLGPLGMALPGLDEPLREQVVTTVRAAFEPYVHGSEVRFTAACWMLEARQDPIQGIRRSGRLH
jgi:SAM-dependent methyltransferase